MKLIASRRRRILALSPAGATIRAELDRILTLLGASSDAFLAEPRSRVARSVGGPADDRRARSRSRTPGKQMVARSTSRAPAGAEPRACPGGTACYKSLIAAAQGMDSLGEADRFDPERPESEFVGHARTGNLWPEYARGYRSGVPRAGRVPRPGPRFSPEQQRGDAD